MSKKEAIKRAGIKPKLCCHPERSEGSHQGNEIKVFIYLHCRVKMAVDFFAKIFMNGVQIWTT